MGFFNGKPNKTESVPDQVIRDHINQAAKSADRATDSWLVKIGKSKWSWAIAIGIVIAAWLLGFIQG